MRHKIRKFMTFFVLSIFLFSTSAYAIDNNESTKTNIETYNKDTVYLKRGFHGARYIKDQKEYFIGLLGGNLANLVSECPSAREEMKKYKKDILIGGGIYFAGVSMITSFIFISKSSEETNYGYVSLLVGGIVGAMVGIVKMSNAMNKADKAVWYYNRYILFEKILSSEDTSSRKDKPINIFGFSKRF